MDKTTLDTILIVLTLLGSLGLFLYGMRLMSESLQKMTGHRMRSVLAAMTSNRFKAAFTGFSVTSIIQSSSASSVMVVSLASAGLISLSESIGLIMGANIGTTLTAWIVWVFGFKVHLGLIVAPLIGLCFPLILSRKQQLRTWGEFVIGFGLIFIGLGYLQETIPPIRNDSPVLLFIAQYSDLGIMSLFMYIIIGMLITVVIQSSSASMALTLVMVSKGWISFDNAAAMVLGENIGTTSTVLLASIVANKSGKRAALSHLVFNAIGVLWIIFFFSFFLHGIDWLVIQLGGLSIYSGMGDISLGLTIFHTAFNLVNFLILINLVPLIIRIVEFLIPVKEDEESFRLQHFDTGLLSTSELSIVQARNEVLNYARHCRRMFGVIRKLFAETNDHEFYQTYNNILNAEELSDRTEVEIAAYLRKLSETELSHSGSERIRALLQIIDEVESIADGITNIANALYRKKQQNAWFTQDLRNNLNDMFGLIDEGLTEMLNNIRDINNTVNYDRAAEIENKLNQKRNKYRSEHLVNIESGEYKYQAGVVYNDILSQAERIGDHIFNVSRTLQFSN